MNAPARFTLYLFFAIIGVFSAVLFFKAEHHDSWGLFDTASRQDAGPPVVEVRDVPAFESIDVQTAVDCEVSIGTPQRVTIEAASGLIHHVRTNVQSGQLVIGTDDQTMRGLHGLRISNQSVRIHITVAALSLVDVEGSGRLAIHHLQGRSFSFQSEGASQLDADGQVDSLSLRIEGASKADTRQLDAKDVVVEVDGVGDAEVRASDSLQATINGIGKIAYVGNPTSVRRDSSGFGSITQIH